MFTNKKSVIFITKSKITVSDVVLGDKPNEKIIGQFGWTPYTLDNVLLQIKRIIDGTIRILLSEDFVYVVNLSLPSGSILNKDFVLQKAQELIPENLRETTWDFKEIASPLPSSSKQLMTTIQVVAVVKTLFEALSKSITKAELQVEAIEPLSYALARFTKQQEKPFLFVYVDTETLLTLAQKEAVLATQRLNSLTPTNINQFIIFAKEKFLAEPQNIVFCGNTNNIDLKEYENLSFKAVIQDISPAISLSYKEDIKGKDEDVLNLGLLKILHKDKNEISNNLPAKAPIQKHHSPNIPIIAMGFFVVLGIFGVLLIYNNNMSLKNNKLSPIPTSLPTLSPTPFVTPTAKIDLSKYSITILNGTGRAKEATNIESLLKDNGFNVIKTGNADNFNYEKTEVSFKEKVPNEFILLLDKSLKTLYDFSIGTKLEEKEDTDILIIIGKSTK
ncbi:MAG: LytR C-terminal domain-containing protein [Patescibacteria group bacterium]